jgi:hypothetical protein
MGWQQASLRWMNEQDGKYRISGLKRDGLGRATYQENCLPAKVTSVAIGASKL